MRIIYNNIADQGTLTASPAMVSTLPVTNLQTQDRELVARTTALAVQTIDVALPSAKPISSAVLYRGNFSSASTWRLRIYSRSTPGAARTNQIKMSETIDDATWSKLLTTVTAEALAAPFGVSNAELVTVSSAGVAAVYQGMTLATSTAHTLSAYVRPVGSLPTMELGVWDYTASAWIALGRFTFATQATSITSGSGTMAVTALSGGWYRVELRFTSHATNTNMGAYFYPRLAAGASAADAMYLWGAQCANEATAGTYIPTTSAPVTEPGEPSGLLYDSGTQYLCAPKTLGDLAWGVDPLGLTMFTGWGYTFSALWFANVYGAFMRITLNDPSNPDGYMQASRLFLGQYWECPGLQRGATLTWQDTTKQMRTEGGGLHSEAGVTYRSLALNIALIPETDRIKLGEMLRSGGMRSDYYVSVFPGLGNALERDHQMQAKLSAIDPTQLVLYGYSSQAFKFEEA